MKNKSFLNFKSIGIIVTLAAAAILFVGCPDGNGGGENADTDGDGIKNANDRCPNGVGSTAGWSSTEATDADRDGSQLAIMQTDSVRSLRGITTPSPTLPFGVIN